MKIVFMGTPDFAVPSLQALLDGGHSVSAVYTQSDKPKGRGHKLAAPPVKELALKYNIPVYQPKSLRGGEAVSQLAALSPDAIVVVAYGKILPPDVLSLPRYGCINVHASLLPKYRGAGPIQWSVLNGEKVTGVTTMFMGEGIDTGDMLLRAETPIGENETAGELHDRLALLGAPLLLETLRRLEEGSLVPTPQDDAQATSAPMLTRELSRLDFSLPAEKLHNRIRGLSPWPCAEAYLRGGRLKIYKSELLRQHRQGMPGEILDEKDFVVACGDGGLLRLAEVQGESSRRMSGADFLRGHPVSAGERLESEKREEE